MRENTEGNHGLIPPHFHVIPDCVMTCEPAAPQPSFSILHSLFSVLFALSYICTPRPHPCSPSPLLALTLVHSRCHRLPLPSSFVITIAFAIATALSRQHADVQHQHTGIYASPGSHLCILKHPRAWPFPLSLSLLLPGEYPQTRHAGTVLHYSSMHMDLTMCYHSNAALRT